MYFGTFWQFLANCLHNLSETRVLLNYLRESTKIAFAQQDSRAIIINIDHQPI